MPADPATAQWIQEARRKAREDYMRETAHEATDTERGITVDLEPALVPTDPRRAKIEALAQHGATAGERTAAIAALHRLDHPSEQTHAATERGSYYARDTLAGSGDE